MSAFAQSSVSLTGRLDVGQTTTNTGATMAANPAITTAKSLAWNNDQTSFYALSGTEDMGAGLKANFRLEQKIENTANQFSDVTDGLRAAYVELADDKMGALRVGFQNTGARDIFAGYTQAKATNVVGELASSTAASSATGASAVAGAADGVGSHTAFATAIKYTAPTFAGVTVAASVTQNESKAATDSKVISAQGYSYGANYVNGPLAAGVSYANARTATTAATGLTTFNLGTADDIDLTVKQTAAAVKYTFANVTGSYIYMKTTQDNSLSATKGNYNRNSGTLGVSAEFGKYVPFATLSTGTLNGNATATGVNDKDQTLKGRQAGVRYNLSKRTSAYAIYGSAERSAADNTKATSKQTAFGLTHLF